MILLNLKHKATLPIFRTLAKLKISIYLSNFQHIHCFQDFSNCCIAVSELRNVFFLESRRPSAANTHTGQVTKSSMGTKHGKGDKADGKTKVKENKLLTEIAESDIQEPPPPITLDVTICLRSWHTAKEVQDWIHSTAD